jgi:hypothetical protein
VVVVVVAPHVQRPLVGAAHLSPARHDARKGGLAPAIVSPWRRRRRRRRGMLREERREKMSRGLPLPPHLPPPWFSTRDALRYFL